jgi:hypothetical protein
VLGVAVPADVGSGGEPAHRHGVRLSTLQNFGLGLAPEVHIPVEVGDPMDLLAHGNPLLIPWATAWIPGRKQPLLSVLGLLRSCAQAEASSSWSRRVACAPALSDNRVPASVQNPGSHFVNARTARFRQAVCRCPLIRLPDAAIGVRRLRALLKQRAALFAAPVVCVCLHGGRSRWSGGEVADTGQCAAGALTLAGPRRD